MGRREAAFSNEPQTIRDLMTDTDDLVGRADARAESYRQGGPSSEHTAALLDELAAALRASRAERDEARDLLAAWSKQNKHAQDAAEARETALKARVAVLETALEPFDLLAAYLQEHAPAASDNDEVGGVSVSMLRRARSLAQGETT